MAISFHFDSSLFENANGRTPRGSGYWVFDISEIDGFEGQSENFHAGWMTLAQAKRWVKPLAERYARARIPGASEITLRIHP